MLHFLHRSNRCWMDSPWEYACCIPSGYDWHGMMSCCSYLPEGVIPQETLYPCPLYFMSWDHHTQWEFLISCEGCRVKLKPVIIKVKIVLTVSQALIETSLRWAQKITLRFIAWQEDMVMCAYKKYRPGIVYWLSKTSKRVTDQCLRSL